MEQRDYQSNLIRQIYQSWKSGNRRVLAQLVTGGGKTIIFSHIARDCLSRGKGVLVVAHRLELITQAKEKLESISGIPCGVIKAGFPVEENLSVQVASVQSLIRRKRYPDAGLVVIDEAHHAVSKSYTSILEKYPDALILGVTATPCRTDGQGFKYLFDDLIIGPSCSELITQGYLSKFKIFASAAKINTKGIRKTAGDFNLGQLEEAANNIIGDVVPTWRKYAEGKRTIIFCVGVDHSKAVVGEFIKNGITAEHLDGETPDDERRDVIARFRSGETTILSNCSLFTEGFDVPNIEAIQIIRPTMSLILHLQMLGRSLRPSPGKEHALIIDHTDNWIRHGLPDEVREWSLEPISLKPALFVQQCPKCHHGFRVLPHEQKAHRHVVDSAGNLKALYQATCPNCQHIFEWEQGEGLEIGESKIIEKEQGELVEVDLTLNHEHKRIIDELIDTAIAKGFNSRWAYHRLIEQYPEKLVNFTYGDLRYLATRLKSDFDFCKRAVKIAESFQEKLLEPIGEITPKFQQVVDGLYQQAQQRKYKLSWIFYRIQEILPEFTFKPTISDWIYVAKLLDYPTNWAYRQHSTTNKV